MSLSATPSNRFAADGLPFRLVRQTFLSLIVGLGTINMLGRLVTLVRALRQPGTCVGDFSAFLNGWRIARSSAGQGLYDIAVQARGFDKTICTNWGRDFPMFVNPPHVALMGWPLGHSTLLGAYTVWAILSIACAAIVILGASRYLSDWNTPNRCVFAVAIVSSPVVMHLAYLGALSFLVSAGVMATIWVVAPPRPLREHLSKLPSTTTRKQWVASFGMAAISIKPQYFLFFLAALIGMRLWGIVFRMTFVMSVVVLAPSLAFGWDTWPKYVSLLSAYAGRDGRNGLDVRSMINIRSILVHFLSGTSADSTATVFLGIAVIGVGLVSHGAVRSQLSATGRSLLLATVTFLAVIASPHTNVQDLVVAVPAIAIVLFHAPKMLRNTVIGLGFLMTVMGPAVHADSVRLFAFFTTFVLLWTTQQQLRFGKNPAKLTVDRKSVAS